MKPKFKHDCDSCIFLGHFYDHDVYFCGQKGLKESDRELLYRTTIISRYSDEGSECASGVSFAQSYYYQILCGENLSVRKTSMASGQGYEEALKRKFIIEDPEFFPIYNGRTLKPGNYEICPDCGESAVSDTWENLKFNYGVEL